MNSTLLHNALILTMESEEIIEGGAVGITGERIELLTTDSAQIEQFLAEHPSAEVVDCQGRLLMPGLINTHTHTPMSIMRNLYEDMSLMEWLEEHVWPFEAKMSTEDIAAGARLSIAEMLLGGTTTFVDMYFSMAHVARVAEDMGVRAHLTETLIVGREQSFLENLDALVEAVQGSSIVTAGVAPHAPYTVPRASAKVAREAAVKYKLPINTHLWETAAEPQMVGENPAEYLDSCNFLEPTTILAHCVHLDGEAIELVAKRGCSVSHCAESNMKLSSGVAPLTAMHRAGVNCTIGTDGVCSNNDLDMWGEMRTAVLLQRVSNTDGLTAYEILSLATRNGARALGMEGELGVLRTGALADIIMVDIHKPHHRPRHNIVSSLVYCAKASDVVMTMVAGRIVVRNSQLIAHDIEEICREVERRAGAIIDR